MATKTLNRNTKQRKSLMKNLVQEVVFHGSIETTEAKAKVIKGLLDKIIHKAQQGTVAARRVLGSFFGTKAVVNRLVDEVAPAMKDRSSGFTRITHLQTRRGDNAEIVRIELVNKPEVRVEEKKEKIESSQRTKSSKGIVKAPAVKKPAVKK